MQSTVNTTAGAFVLSTYVKCGDATPIRHIIMSSE